MDRSQPPPPFQSHSNPFLVESESLEMPQYRLRRMRPEDVPAVLEIWAENELHEGLETIQSFMAVDRDGFVVAVEVADEEEGEAEAGATAAKAEDSDLQSSSTESTPTVVISEEPKVTSPSGLGAIFQKKKQICCCAVQAPNSPPPPLEMNSIVASSSKSSGLIGRRMEKRILGMCAGVFVHPSIAFIGLYAVRPELHGRGIGMSMWTRMMEHLNGRNAGLYAVVQHLSMYRDRAGFRHPDERLLFIYESAEEEVLRVDLLVDALRGVEIVPVEESLLEQVARFDGEVHGYDRKRLLERVVKEKGSAALVALDIEETDDQSGTSYSILGYGCIRTNNIGKAMLGPVYAANDAVAELLMRRLFAALPGPFSRGLLYMTLDSNPGGERIAEKLGLVKHEELPRFFLGQPYREAKWNAVYCIHSPNFSLL